MLCHACQKEIPYVDKVSFRGECPHCSEDAHVCLNCDFYDANIYNECRETSADRITQKDKANYCEFFIPKIQTTTPGEVKTNPIDDAKRKLEELFRKS